MGNFTRTVSQASLSILGGKTSVEGPDDYERWELEKRGENLWKLLKL